MKILKIPLWLLWRLWFYTLVIGVIIIISPLLLWTATDEKYYPKFWKLARFWAYTVFYGMGFRLHKTIEQATEKGKNYMFCPNHTSFLDVFILIILSKNPIVFVGKKELEKLPIFGYFFKRFCISVDRTNLKSRKAVYNSARSKLKQGLSIAIFPEGLVPDENVVLAPFKSGAFRLAIEHQIPIVPHIYFDCKRFFSWTIFKGRPGIIRIKQCKHIYTNNLTEKNVNELKFKTFNTIHKALYNDKKYITDTNRKD